MELVSTWPRLALDLRVFAAFPARTAILRSGEIGCHAVGLPASRREFSPLTLGQSGARDLASFLARNGLAVSWVSAGESGCFTVSSTAQEDVERVLAVIDLAARLRAASAAVRVGQLGDSESPAAARLNEALQFLADPADRAAVKLALQPARGEENILDDALAPFHDAPVGRLLNPGETLFAGRDPVADVMSASGIAAVAASDSSAQSSDLPPGRGRVPWRDFLAALDAGGYHDCVTVTFAEDRDSLAAASASLELLRRRGV